MKSKSNSTVLYYSAQDLALILSGFGLDCQSEAEVINCIWENERPFLQERYRTDKRRLLLDILYWERYLADKPSHDAEFQSIQRDVRESGGSLEEKDYVSDFAGIDRFFKETRIRILYGPGVNYVCIKRKTLISQYKQRRFSKQLKERIENCLRFYRLDTYKRGGTPCRVEDARSNDTIVFRIAADKDNQS